MARGGRASRAWAWPQLILMFAAIAFPDMLHNGIGQPAAASDNVSVFVHQTAACMDM